MKLRKRGDTREDGFKFNGYTTSNKEHWVSEEFWQKINLKGKITRWKNKLKVIEHYGGECCHCKEKDPIVLTVDHVNNDGKNHVDSKGRRITGNQLYSEIIKNNFPNRFQILCCNCNQRKELERRGTYCGE